MSQNSYSEIYLHMAWHTKASLPLLTPEVENVGLRPDELYLTADELRSQIDRRQRVEMRALGMSAEMNAWWRRCTREVVDMRMQKGARASGTRARGCAHLGYGREQ